MKHYIRPQNLYIYQNIFAEPEPEPELHDLEQRVSINQLVLLDHESLNL